jgi:hypothetical protein
MKPTILLIAVTAAVIVTACVSGAEQRTKDGQSTAADFFASVHINSKDVMSVSMCELPHPMKLVGASPAVQWRELTHSRKTIVSDLFYGNKPLKNPGLDVQGLRRMVLSILLQRPGNRTAGGGAYIIVRDSLVNNFYSAEIHRFSAEQTRGTAPANPKQKSG